MTNPLIEKTLHIHLEPHTVRKGSNVGEAFKAHQKGKHVAVHREYKLDESYPLRLCITLEDLNDQLEINDFFERYKGKLDEPIRAENYYEITYSFLIQSPHQIADIYQDLEASGFVMDKTRDELKTQAQSIISNPDEAIAQQRKWVDGAIRYISRTGRAERN